MTLHLDYETRSSADISEVGAFRYAADPSTEIFCAAIALNDDAPLIWVNPKFEFDDGLYKVQSDPGVYDLLDMLNYRDNLVYAHNAQFEFAITGHNGHGINVQHSQWRCTAAMCRRAAIPASLDKAAQTLGLAQQKDARGKTLIRKFSIPKKDGTFTQPQDDPAAFLEFLAYCKQDVRVERDIHKKLHAFELKGSVLETFQLDMTINARGLTVNVPALQYAQELITMTEDRLTAEFQELTGLNPGQRDKFIEWLRERGFTGANLQAATLDEEIEDADFDATSDVGRALVLKKSLSYASIKKVKSMLACADLNDGRVRGTLQYHGASTGRWSGRLIQPQNFKRPTIKHTDAAYADICAGEPLDYIELMNGPVLEVLSSCIRHFIQDPAGMLFDVDYSAIEARIVCWLAGQEDAVAEYRQNIDRYKRMASVIYNVPADKVDDFPQRFVGKQATLGCGYGMGPPKFRATCAKYGYDLPVGLEDIAVKAFRNTHKQVVNYWYSCEKQIKRAIANPGTKYPCGKVDFFCLETAGSRYLFARLPSGRHIAYRDPQVHDDRISYYGQVEGKVMWGRVDLYGGKAVENLVQAIAADIMSHGALTAEQAGFKIATLVHDQCLAYHGDKARLDELCHCLTSLPAWAAGMPVAVEGKVVPYYKK